MDCLTCLDPIEWGRGYTWSCMCPICETCIHDIQTSASTRCGHCQKEYHPSSIPIPYHPINNDNHRAIMKWMSIFHEWSKCRQLAMESIAYHLNYPLWIAITDKSTLPLLYQEIWDWIHWVTNLAEVEHHVWASMLVMGVSTQDIQPYLNELIRQMGSIPARTWKTHTPVYTININCSEAQCHEDYLITSHSSRIHVQSASTGKEISTYLLDDILDDDLADDYIQTFTMDSHHHVWIVTRKQVNCWTLDGDLIEKLPISRDLNFISSIAILPSGNFVIHASNKCYIIDRQWTTRKHVGGLFDINSVVVSPTGEIWIHSNLSFYIYSPEGDFLRQLHCRGESFIVSSSHYLYIADIENSIIRMYTHDGQEMYQWTPESRIHALMMRGDGRIGVQSTGCIQFY